MEAKKLGYILLIIFLGYVISYFLPLEEYPILVFADAFFAVIAFVAAIFCFSTFKIYGKNSLEGKVWLMLTLGFIFWCGGESLWAYYELVEGIYPFPSPADIFYLLGYVPLCLAVFYSFYFMKVPFKRRKVGIALTLTIAYAALSGIFVLYPIAVSQESLFEKAVLLMYPLADIFLIFGASLLVEVFRGGGLSKTWLIISLAFLATGIADTLFSYLDWNGLYELGSPYDYIDFLWIFSYLLFIFGAYHERMSALSAIESAKALRKKKRKKK